MANPVKITATVITFNEEKNIERCLKSLLPVADELIVVDSYSTDKTEEIARSLGVTFIQNPFEGYVEQRNYSVAQAKYEYVLSLDADEVIDKTLQKSILAVKADWKADLYEFKRLTNYCGHWIRHGGWYPDPKIRLIDRSKGKYSGTNPHDKFEALPEAKIVRLEGDLLHYSFNSIREHIQVLNKYSEIGAEKAFLKGKKSGLFAILSHSLYRFFWGYFLRLGILDGYYGFVIAIISTFATFIKYVKLKEMNLEAKKK